MWSKKEFDTRNANSFVPSVFLFSFWSRYAYIEGRRSVILHLIVKNSFHSFCSTIFHNIVLALDLYRSIWPDKKARSFWSRSTYVSKRTNVAYTLYGAHNTNFGPNCFTECIWPLADDKHSRTKNDHASSRYKNATCQGKTTKCA